jgi:hypothetical protein
LDIILVRGLIFFFFFWGGGACNGKEKGGIKGVRDAGKVRGTYHIIEVHFTKEGYVVFRLKLDPPEFGIVSSFLDDDNASTAPGRVERGHLAPAVFPAVVALHQAQAPGLIVAAHREQLLTQNAYAFTVAWSDFNNLIIPTLKWYKQKNLRHVY